MYKSFSQGDSGGGVVYKEMIYGVHSSSGVIACAQEARFMDVCKYKDWIKKTAGINSDKLKACLGCG